MLIELLIAGLLGLFFLFASSIKILGWHKTVFEIQLAFFQKYGLNRSIMRFIGFVELFGAMSICFVGTMWGFLGALAIFVTSLGAICFHLTFDKWVDGIPASVTLALSGILVFRQMPIFFS